MFRVRFRPKDDDLVYEALCVAGFMTTDPALDTAQARTKLCKHAEQRSLRLDIHDEHIILLAARVLAGSPLVEILIDRWLAAKQVTITAADIAAANHFMEARPQDESLATLRSNLWTDLVRDLPENERRRADYQYIFGRPSTNGERFKAGLKRWARSAGPVVSGGPDGSWDAGGG